MMRSLESSPPVVAWLNARDFARARRLPGFARWRNWREFRDERDALFVSLGFAGVKACRQMAPFEAFERWVRLTGASADLAGLDEFAAHWRWRRAHPQATVVGRFREDGATGVATAQGIQCVPIRAESYAIWRAEIVRLALFAAPNLDDYATHAIACCMAARERSPVSSS